MNEATAGIHGRPSESDLGARPGAGLIALSLRRVPFRVRLTLSFAVVMVVLFGGLALLLQTLFSASLDQGIDRSLHTHAADLATLVRGRFELPDLPESGGAFAQIVDPATGRVRDATPGHGAALLSPQQVRRAAAGSLLLDPGENARLLAAPVSTRPPAVLVVGSSLSERNRALTTLSDLLFIGGPVLLILTCVAGYVLAARALAPVEKMSAQAARISGAPRGERLPVPEANDELHRLGETVNAMLSRLEDTLGRERALVADAGHELRTPLSILKLELELALGSDSSREELQTRVRSAAEEVDRLAKLADDLLVIARAEQGRLPLEKRRVEVGQVLDVVAARFATAAGGEGRSVRLEGSGRLAVQADRARLEQALTNMVSNALWHGGGEVVLRADKHTGTVELHVLDEGHGFEPGFLPRAFERFSRGDPARSRGGAGLGLSIVQVIAEAHGGRAYAANRAGGGADVWLSLPAT
jgi:signal transduction histidine kinase